MSKDYYEILGVAKTATQDEIKKAYRKLAHQHHPDKANGNEKKFKEINEAYQTLSDPQKRSQFDQFGSAFNQSGGYGSYSDAGGFGGFSGFNQGFQNANFDFSDVDLSDVFGEFFGFGGGRKGRKRKTRGDDLEISLDISFEDSVSGVEREVELYRRMRCDRCEGKGAEPDSKIETCYACGGTGKTTKTTQTFFGAFQQTAICSECRGEGKKPEFPCSKCGGDGRVRENREVKIKIPAGITSGQTLEILGQGEAGNRGGQAGNLYVRINVQPHKFFEREGNDLICEVPISFTQAALGDNITIESFDGEVNFEISAGVQSGEAFRIAGRGVPDVNGGAKGDLVMKLKIITPKRLTREEKELLEALKRADGETANLSRKSFWKKIFEE